MLGGHLLDNKKPAIIDIENWNSFIAHARELIDDWERLEEIRQANEQQRELTESARQTEFETNETSRQANELVREEAENNRQSTFETNETERQNEFEENEQQRQDNYQELLDTGVLQTNINTKLEQLEEEYTPKLTEVTAQLQQTEQELSSQLAQKVSNAQINNFGLNVRLAPYNAKGDGVADDTAAVQMAIDDAHLMGSKVIVPHGSYLIKSTLFLPESIVIEGYSNNRDAFDTAHKDTSALLFDCPIGFQSKVANKKCRMDMTGIYAKCIYSEELGITTLFDGINFHASKIEYNLVFMFDVVFNCTFSRLSWVQYNHFLNIRKYFLAVPISNQANFFDSYIQYNYINANPGYNATCFQTSGLSGSRIMNNYIDYFKYVFKPVNVGIRKCLITGNIFDLCFRVIDAFVTETAISYEYQKGNPYAQP